MKKTITGVLIAVGAAGAYLVYKNWDKILAKLQGDKNDENDEPGTGGNDNPETGYQNLPYAKKVEYLQGLLQIRIDGDPGKQTNGTLDFYYDAKRNYSLADHVAYAQQNNYPNLRLNGKGVVSESNVDFYIDAFQKAQTPRQKTWKYGGYNNAAAQTRANYGHKLLSARSQGKKVFAKQDIRTEERRFSAATNTFVQTGPFLVKKGDVVPANLKITYNGEGYWIMPVAGKTDRFIVVSPYLFDA